MGLAQHDGARGIGESHTIEEQRLGVNAKQALETSAETVKRALDQAVHEIFVAAMIGVEKLLRIDLDATQGPVSLVRQVLDRLPEGVPAFGKTAGFVVKQGLRADGDAP